uniref:Uncharacterized protein n=1 Tax=Sphaerodactylus townsendi TaxID=933632 RepID=A0ACB8EQQ4_9SAUR
MIPSANPINKHHSVKWPRHFFNLCHSNFSLFLNPQWNMTPDFPLPLLGFGKETATKPSAFCWSSPMMSRCLDKGRLCGNLPLPPTLIEVSIHLVFYSLQGLNSAECLSILVKRSFHYYSCLYTQALLLTFNVQNCYSNCKII